MACEGTSWRCVLAVVRVEERCFWGETMFWQMHPMGTWLRLGMKMMFG
jgi:hypothetical protein